MNIFKRAFEYFTGRDIERIAQKAYATGVKSAIQGIDEARSILGGKRPGYWSSDHYQESQNNKGWVYCAATTIADQVAQATVEPKEVRDKSHPLYKILFRPNPDQSRAVFDYHRALNLVMTGINITWNVKNRAGSEIVERYSIPTAILAPTPSGWRISLASIAGAVNWSEYPTRLYSILNQILPYEETSVCRFPHLYVLGDGQSPVSACSHWIDSATQIDESRFNANANATRPGGIVNETDSFEGSKEDRDRIKAELRSQTGGSENRGNNLYLPRGLEWTPWANTPIELDHYNSFTQVRDAIFATFRVPPISAGVNEAGSYAAYYAALMQLAELRIQPILNLMADEDKRSFENAEMELPEEFTYKVKRIDDPDITESRVMVMKNSGACSVNEMRAELDLPPMDGEQYNVPLGYFRDDVDVAPEGLEQQAPKKDETSTGHDNPQRPTGGANLNGKQWHDRNGTLAELVGKDLQTESERPINLNLTLNQPITNHVAGAETKIEQPLIIKSDMVIKADMPVKLEASITAPISAPIQATIHAPITNVIPTADTTKEIEYDERDRPVKIDTKVTHAGNGNGAT